MLWHSSAHVLGMLIFSFRSYCPIFMLFCALPAGWTVDSFAVIFPTGQALEQLTPDLRVFLADGPALDEGLSFPSASLSSLVIRKIRFFPFPPVLLPL